MDDYKLECENQIAYRLSHENTIMSAQDIINMLGHNLEACLHSYGFPYTKTDIICVKEAIQSILEPHYSAAQRELREGGYEYEQVTTE